MRSRRAILPALVCLLAPLALRAQSASCAGIAAGPGASLNGFVPFASASLWNTDISGALVDPNSSNILGYIGANTTLHPDFGSGLYNGSAIGIPYQVEEAGEPEVRVRVTAYASESDPGPASIPKDALIEGYPSAADGDRHVLVLEKGGCWLYELFHAQRKPNGKWEAASAALWDLLGAQQRPFTWTSADAAGLPIFPGLVRYDEVADGAIHHALRYTAPRTRQAFVLPATHWASRITDPNAPPMGARLRLKASFDISGFSPANQVILTALKRYGMILADNGSGIYLSGAPDDRWDNDDLHALKHLTAADFEVVNMDTVYTPANVPQAPAISVFTANPAEVPAGSTVMLSWSVSDAGYNMITPEAGPVRGIAVAVHPARTTTYTLSSTNAFGRTVRTVTVTVR